MIIIYLNDGLGNQMFQFALFRKLQALGRDICIYDFDLRGTRAKHNGLELESVFALSYKQLSKKEFRRYDTSNLVNHIIRKILYEKKYSIYEEEMLSFKEEIFSMDNICLKGYWQSEKYFQNIENQIRKDFVFPPLEDKKNNYILEQISNSNSIALHVRRGDYILPKYENVFGCICNEEYYKKSIEYMKERVEKPKFFVFSNDIKWCKDNLPDDNFIYVEGNSKKKSYIDMQLMASCKHQIIANSSFSWWSAWLNANIDKIVVCPTKWINGKTVKDIWCEGWVKIG